MDVTMRVDSQRNKTAGDDFWWLTYILYLPVKMSNYSYTLGVFDKLATQVFF